MTDANDAPRRTFGPGRLLAWGLALAFGLGASFLLAWSTKYANQQNSDTLMYVFASLQKMTWYFWGQDRILNLLPALAAPVRDPALNLDVQLVLRCFSAALAPLAMVALIHEGRKSLATVAIGAVVTAMVVACFKWAAMMAWIFDGVPYSTAMIFAVGGVWAWAQSRSRNPVVAAVLIGLSLLLTLTAYLLNIGLAMVAGPMMLAYFFMTPQATFDLRPRSFGLQSERWVGVIHVIALVAALFHAKTFGMFTDWPTTPGATFRPEVFVLAFTNIARDAGPLPYLWAAAAPVVLFAPLHERRWKIALSLVLGSVTAILVTSQLNHVNANEVSVRYFLIPIVTLTSVSAFALWTQARMALDGAPGIASKAVAALGAIAATGLSLAALFWSGEGLVKDRFLIGGARLESSQEIATASLGADADVLVGDYWSVWPALYERLVLNHDAGRKATVFVAANRGRVLKLAFRDRLASGDAMRSFCWLADEEECKRNITTFLEVPETMRIDFKRVSAMKLLSTGQIAVVHEFRQAAP